MNKRLQRFTPVQRLFHALLMLSFLVQAASGLGRMYMESGWGRGLCALFGGYEGAFTVHRAVGIFMIAGFVVHFVYLLGRIRWNRLSESLSGPDSLVPTVRDIRHFFQHLAWFFRMRPVPQFDRWGYWEKFDYWAVFWGMVIIGGSGLLLAYPVAASGLVPGWGLNVAFWVHRIEALLAIGHVCIIHFFIGHLRRHHFPMDRAIFEGSVDLHKVTAERPKWVSRLFVDKRLETLQVTESPPGVKALQYGVGYAAMAAGLYLLVGAIANAARITW